MFWVSIFWGGAAVIVSLVLVLGGILAWRCEKTWRSMLMLVGGSLELLGVIYYNIVMPYLLFSDKVSLDLAKSVGNSWLTTSGMQVAISLGNVLFCIGFVTYCARAGAAAIRAKELEQMLVHLQQRLAEEDTK